MADVYVLASPTPTLYIYPSQLHPLEPDPPTPEERDGLFGYVYPTEPNVVPRSRRQLDEEALVALSAL